MSAIEFTAQSGKAFSVQLYNATTLAAVGTALTPTGVGGNYRVSTAATGVVYVEATATNLLVTGFANLDDAAANGYSALRDTYDEAATPLASIDSSLTAAKGSGFDTTTDSLEAIRNRGDAAWVSGGASVTVLPVTGTEISRVTGTAIQLFTNELITVAVGVTDAAGDPVDLTGLTLELVFESGATEVVIVDASITKTTSSFSFTSTSTLTASERLWKWALRKTSDEAVIVNGTLEVVYSPNN